MDVTLMLREAEITGIDIAEGFSRFDDIDIYLKVLRSYSKNMRLILAKAAAFHEERLREYEIAIHSIKGASLDILAEGVGNKAKALETAAKSGDIDYIREHNASFISESSQLLDDIDALLNAVSAANSTPVKDMPDKALLTRLCNACAAYDVDEADDAMAEISKFLYTSDDGLVGWLQENVALTNFAEIVERLGRYL